MDLCPAMHAPPDSITRENVSYARQAPGKRPSILYITGSEVRLWGRTRLCQRKGIPMVGYSGLTEWQERENPQLLNLSLITSTRLTSSVLRFSVRGTLASVVISASYSPPSPISCHRDIRPSGNTYPK